MAYSTQEEREREGEEASTGEGLRSRSLASRAHGVRAGLPLLLSTLARLPGSQWRPYEQTACATVIDRENGAVKLEHPEREHRLVSLPRSRCNDDDDCSRALAAKLAEKRESYPGEESDNIVAKSLLSVRLILARPSPAKTEQKQWGATRITAIC